MEKLKHKSTGWRVILVPGMRKEALHSYTHIGEVFFTHGEPTWRSIFCKGCGKQSKCPGFVVPPWNHLRRGCWGYNNGFHIERIG